MIRFLLSLSKYESLASLQIGVGAKKLFWVVEWPCIRVLQILQGYWGLVNEKPEMFRLVCRRIGDQGQLSFLVLCFSFPICGPGELYGSP